ncbi:MAG: amino acid permease [Candidatus Aenigmarchaeota archaeon]|nr:amino acid permease [Candidatus Aenigmarchaeota archaeon]
MPKLRRSLSLLEVCVYGVGIILGAGIYALIGEGSLVAGNALWLSFLIGAVIAGMSGLSYAELGSMFPKEAAEYIYSKKAFRNNIIPFIIGWTTIFTGIIAASTVAIGFGGYFSALTGLNPLISAICLVLLLSFINFYGIEESAKINLVFTAIELLGLLLIIILGAEFLGSVDYFYSPTGMTGIFSAATLVFFSFLGFEDIVNVSEETENPKKVIPKALMISLAVTTIIYILVAMATVSILPWNVIGASSAPLADVAESAMPGSSTLLSIVAIFATANTVLIQLIVCSRMIYGMSKEKSSLPKFLSTIHKKRKTPWIAALVCMVFSIALIFLGDIKIVAEVTNFGSFMIFLSVNMSVILLRYKEPKIKRVFKVPLNIGKFPILPFVSMLFTIYMFTFFGIDIIAFGLFMLFVGFVTYLMLNRSID